MKYLPKIAWFAVLLVAIVSCIKYIYEPDIWWQIATGNWIIENGKVPTVDIFSHTYAGEPWVNVKWGAEVIMAWIDTNFGVELLPILQILCLLGILYFVKKLYNQFSQSNYNVSTGDKTFGNIIASLIFLFVVNFRLNSRPEMFSHLFSIVSIFLILNYKKTNSNLVFLLIPLQIIWTNMHEAFGMGIVLIIIFLIGFWVEHLFLNKKNFGISFKPAKYTIAGVLSIFATAINPQGFKMIAHPFNIFGQLNDNKFTEELISFHMDGYWKYQAIFMTIITFIILYSIFKKSEIPFLLRPIKKYGLGYSLVLAAFLFLSLTSFRNIPFFMIVATPVLGSIIFKMEWKKEKKKNLYLLALTASIIFYISITTNYLYEKLLPNEQYGLSINAEKTPIGAANFIKENQLHGKEFVDYLSSSYLIYDIPGFKSYIDLRDLDVFPTIFFENVFFLYQAPTAVQPNGKTPWQIADEADTLNYVVLLNSPIFKNLNNYLLHQNKDFTLVYGDVLNSIFVRNTVENENIISQFGYNAKREIFSDITQANDNIIANSISRIFWPLYTKKLNKNNVLNRNAYHQYMEIP